VIARFAVLQAAFDSLHYGISEAERAISLRQRKGGTFFASISPCNIVAIIHESPKGKATAKSSEIALRRRLFTIYPTNLTDSVVQGIRGAREQSIGDMTAKWDI
jgi:hypothetical protein